MTDKVQKEYEAAVLHRKMEQRANEPTMTQRQVEDAITKLRADAKRGIVTSIEWETYDPDQAGLGQPGAKEAV
jgi:hypothetical protein